MLAAAMMVLFSCNKPNDDKQDNPKENPEENPSENPGGQEEKPGESVKIVIDGKFDDWANIEGAAIAKNNPDSPFEGVKEIRVYADPEYVYYYVKYDKETLQALFEDNDNLYIRLCLNTDGEFTSGYDQYFLESYDFIVEGALGNGAGGWSEFDGTMFQRTYLPEKQKDGWLTLLNPGSGLVYGKGEGNEYEIWLDRELFDKAVPTSTDPNSPIGDEFYTGMRFYCGDWAQLSNMPNASVEDGDGSGWGHMMKIQTTK